LGDSLGPRGPIGVGVRIGVGGAAGLNGPAGARGWAGRGLCPSGWGLCPSGWGRWLGAGWGWRGGGGRLGCRGRRRRPGDYPELEVELLFEDGVVEVGSRGIDPACGLFPGDGVGARFGFVQLLDLRADRRGDDLRVGLARLQAEHLIRMRLDRVGRQRQQRLGSGESKHQGGRVGEGSRLGPIMGPRPPNCQRSKPAWGDWRGQKWPLGRICRWCGRGCGFRLGRRDPPPNPLDRRHRLPGGKALATGAE
jgi:hypothetical protein